MTVNLFTMRQEDGASERVFVIERHLDRNKLHKVVR